MTAVHPHALEAAPERPPLRVRLALHEVDGVTLLALPAILFVAALFVYPFLYGLVLSLMPKASATTSGDWLANYRKFFSDPYLYGTIAATLWLAVPATLINVVFSIPVAMQVRRLKYRRVLTTILVVPITLGTVLIAEGLLNYLGPQGWFNRTLALAGITPVRLVHNYTGVMLSLIMSGFPFTFLLTLSYVTGIDPSLEQAAATLGAKAWSRFRHVILPLLAQGLAINLCLSFVQTFSVFPSAVLLGAPAGATRVISIAAYQAAYEQYDYSMASAVAMIMGFIQLAVVAVILAARALAYRGSAAGGKG
jgi:putative spermidine/putrescine transport system permease protein